MVHLLGSALAATAGTLRVGYLRDSGGLALLATVVGWAPLPALSLELRLAPGDLREGEEAAGAVLAVARRCAAARVAGELLALLLERELETLGNGEGLLAGLALALYHGLLGLLALGAALLAARGQLQALRLEEGHLLGGELHQALALLGRARVLGYELLCGGLASCGVVALLGVHEAARVGLVVVTVLALARHHLLLRGVGKLRAALLLAGADEAGAVLAAVQAALDALLLGKELSAPVRNAHRVALGDLKLVLAVVVDVGAHAFSAAAAAATATATSRLKRGGDVHELHSPRHVKQADGPRHLLGCERELGRGSCKCQVGIKVADGAAAATAAARRLVHRSEGAAPHLLLGRGWHGGHDGSRGWRQEGRSGDGRHEHGRSALHCNVGIEGRLVVDQLAVDGLEGERRIHNDPSERHAHLGPREEPARVLERDVG